MKFYAANNSYSTETSLGFSNTWYVLAFESKETRDTYLLYADSLAARSINCQDIGDYIKRVPRPFSRERFAITLPARDLPGLIGVVDVTHPDAPDYVCEL